MGKPKKDRKNRQEEEFGDDDVDLDPLANTGDTEMASAPSNKLSKKEKRKKKGRKEEEEEDDIADKMESLAMDSDEVNGEPEIPKPQKSKKAKKKSKKKEESDEEDEDVTQTTSASASRNKTKMTAFDMLAALDDDNDMLQSEDESDSETKSENQKLTEEVVLTPVDTEASTSKKKEKKKKAKKVTEEEEDIDAILAALEQPKEKSGKKSKKDKKQADSEEKKQTETESAMQTENESSVGKEAEEGTEGDKVVFSEPKVVTMEDLDDEEEEDTKKKKKKGKKKEKKETTEVEQEEGEEPGEEGEHSVKTAAQKKKEKKEREKKKKEQQRLQSKKKEGTPVSDTPEGNKLEDEGTQATEEGAAEAENEEDEAEGKGKKKKKKGKEEKEPKKKGPSKQIAALKEHLKKVQEEEERLRLEEEDKQRRLEEARLQKEEQKRLEEERKQRKKQKEKERIEKLKAEGKFLTAKQKQERKRAMQMLEVMKAQGLDIPNKDDVPKKRPIYSKKKKTMQRQESQEDTEKSPSPVEAVETLKESSPETPTEETPAVVEQEEEADEVKDSWDVSDDEEEEVKEEAVKPAGKGVSVSVRSKSEEKDEDEESEEESEEDEEEESSEEESSEESSEEESEEEMDAVEKAKAKIEKRREEAEKKRTTDVLRAPVVCVLGHVDTGKTKILDKLRRTNVQDGEAGGITQQIGATNVPRDAIRDKTTMCKEFHKAELKLPGLLIIDTPGHESFSNLRSRGSSLCDIAILVVDIMHGLEPQTIESIELLKSRKTPFIVALNKIDRLYQWKPQPNSDVVNTLKKQHPNTKIEFDERTREVVVQFAEQGLNAALFYENKNLREYVSLVPTSAHSGDGMGNLVALICELTQDLLAKRVSYSEELQATVMEVKAIHGLGTTIDVILVNGKIHEGQTIVTAGTEGPIVTQIRGLLMPQPMKELRVKNQYEKHKEVLAAQGVKMIAKDLEKALAGLPLYVAHDADEVEYYKEEVSRAFKAVLSSIKLQERGVFVQASTLGSLEALLEFLRTSKIPYAGIGIGPVHKKDIMKASIMLEHDNQYAVILAFDVKVEREAQELADSMGVRIFSADIIYHLFDKFMAYREELKKKRQDEFKHIAVFPTKLRILPQYIFNTRDPIVVGVIVEAGFVKEGTPLCVPSKEFVEIGRITSIEFNHKQIDTARKGQEVCIKIEPSSGETPKLYGRHFDATDLLVSKISRQSIDVVKEYFRDEMSKPDWQLIMELKKMFQII